MVSVIIPTYKRSLRLSVAIESVLKQTYSPVEIIVVDDNNDDEFRKDTKSVLQPYLDEELITLIQHDQNKGGCKARNTGGFHSNGDYLAFLDDDDFYEPTKIEQQLLFLTENDRLDACMCSMYRVDEEGKQIVSRENKARGISLKEAVLDGNLFTSMLLIKKEKFLQLKGFSEIPRYQDKYFHYEFLDKGCRIGILDKQLFTLVEHNDFRISTSASDKVIKALDTLHIFEVKHKDMFSSKEWKYILHRLYYHKSYTLCQGNICQRIRGMSYVIKSLKYYTGDFNVLKIILKTFIPNFILKYKSK